MTLEKVAINQDETQSGEYFWAMHAECFSRLRKGAGFEPCTPPAGWERVRAIVTEIAPLLKTGRPMVLTQVSSNFHASIQKLVELFCGATQGYFRARLVAGMETTMLHGEGSALKKHGAAVEEMIFKRLGSLKSKLRPREDVSSKQRTGSQQGTDQVGRPSDLSCLLPPTLVRFALTRGRARPFNAGKELYQGHLPPGVGGRAGGPVQSPARGAGAGGRRGI